jgi:putative MATE family efflux protein
MQLHHQNRESNVLDTDRISWLLFKLATPVFFGMFVQTLYNVINTIFIGHFVGPLGIAGLSIVFPLQMVSWGVSQMVGIGGASLISRLIGKGDIPGAEKTIGNGITVGIFMAILVTVIIAPFSTFWLKLIGASEEVMPYARPYLIIIMSGTVFNVFAMSLLSFVRAEGNARVGMVAMMMGAILSIILDAIFVIPLKMGVVGAGLATIISQIVSMIYLFSYYLTGSSYLKLHVRNLKIDFSILKQMLAIGIAAFVQTITSSLSAMIMIHTVIKYGGDSALEAFGIIQRVMIFVTLPAMVFGQGLQPILGFNYGAKRYHLALKGIYIAAIFSTVMSILGFAIIYLIPGPIMRVFTTDQALIDMGVYASRLIFLSLPFMGGVMVGQLIFQAIGKAVQSFITAIVRPILFLIPLVMIMSNLWQLDGVFLAFPSADILTLLMIVVLITPILRQFRKAAIAENALQTAGSFSLEKMMDTKQSTGVSK